MEFESTVSGEETPEKSGYQTHIPVHVARHLKLQKGDVLIWDVLDGRVYVVKKEPEK